MVAGVGIGIHANAAVKNRVNDEEKLEAKDVNPGTTALDREDFKRNKNRRILTTASNRHLERKIRSVNSFSYFISSQKA